MSGQARRLFAERGDVRPDEDIEIAKVDEGLVDRSRIVEVEHVDMASLPKRRAYHAFKRGFDICFSAILTIATVVPVGAACVAIMLESPGKPFYLQERMGRGGKPFKIIKLRSMVPDAENVERYLSSEQLMQWQSERKVCDDPRITKVGRFIRRCSIYEFPQFINVLRGEMSVVGPRPISSDELSRWFSREEQEVLLSVVPGITGCWQVSASGEKTYENGQRQQLELWYVKNASLLVDLKAMIGTAFAIVRRDGD